MKYRVILAGCDESTIVDVDLTDEQHAFLVGLAERFAETSTFDCMPVMKIAVAPEGEAH